MNELYRNKSGYNDPTAGKAMTRIAKEDEKLKEKALLNEMKHRSKVYVVSAYRGNPEVNTYRACKYCKYVISQGKMPIASHLLYPQFLNDKDESQRKLGCQFGLALLALCDEVWVFNQHRELSEGMRAEIKEARLLGKPVKYHNTKELKI